MSALSASQGSSSAGVRIVDVWAENLSAVFRDIRELIITHPYVSMDTEFPGVVARPVGLSLFGKGASASEFHYQTLRCNVDLLRIIQLGITLTDEWGNLPKRGPGEEGEGEEYGCWQFNFKFDLESDMYLADSINLLTNSGLDFERHRTHGIEPDDFANLLITSGLVLEDEGVEWVSFHSGYDFGYLLKSLTDDALPDTEEGFFELMQVWFPRIWDIKYVMKSVKTLKGGLQEVADDLGVPRIGPQHQAGSDSLLTAGTFFAMKRRFFGDNIDDSLRGVLFGLNLLHPEPRANGAFYSSTPYTSHASIPGATPGREQSGPPLPGAASVAMMNSIWRPARDSPAGIIANPPSRTDVRDKAAGDGSASEGPMSPDR
ncbi:CAF1-domain-containing protein [Atractiella rhizophila]|nr:CAF1-domain-containing protein [Atractiella rhizophila]